MKCIPIWNRCNNQCLMCSNPTDYALTGRYSFSALKARVDGIPAAEREIYLTGGEPSLHPQLFPLLSYIRETHPRARILMDTNGRRFSYRGFAAGCAAFGNIEFQVSLCGHNAAAHDAVTLTPGSFRQTLAGLKNLLALGPAGADVEARFVLSGLSIGDMGRVYGLARKKLKGIKALVFIFMEMEGRAGENLKTAGLTYTAALPLVVEFFAGVKSAPFELKLYHFPLCALPPELWRYAWRTLPKKELAFPKSCARCAVRRYCLGVHKDYLKYFGAAEFKAVRTAPRLETSSNFCHPITEVSGCGR